MTVGVVGAGITGLAACHHLRARGAGVRVFESRERAGGVIRSTRRDGLVLEHGPQRIRRTTAVAELVEATGLESSVVAADQSLPIYVFAAGELRPAPTSIRRFLRTDLLSWRAKLRILAEPLTSRGQPDESAAGLLRRKFGDEAYENLLGPLFGGLYGSDPERMPAGHALAPLLRREAQSGSLLRLAIGRLLGGNTPAAISFDDGLQQFPEALAARYGEHVSLGRPVTAIEQTGDGFRLMARGEFMAAEAVILTVPAPAAADLLDSIAPEAADALRSLTYNPLAVVHLRAPTDRRGLGYQVRRDEGLSTLGVTWNGATFDRDGLSTAFLGGMEDHDLVEREAAEIGDIAAEEFEAVMGVSAEVVNVTRLPRAIPAWDHTWTALESLSLPDGVHLATNYTGRLGVPSRIREAADLAERLA